MSEKKLERVFPLYCCQMWKTFVFDDFTHDGRMTIICHRHEVPIERHITWKSGIDKEDFDKGLEEYKKKKAEKSQPPLA